MGDSGKVLCGWTWEENKLFELALAVVDQGHPARWEVVAAMLGGNKSAHEVHKHYVILLEDLQYIESGKFDHNLAEAQPYLQVDCTAQSVCCTDEDHKSPAGYDDIMKRERERAREEAVHEWRHNSNASVEKLHPCSVSSLSVYFAHSLLHFNINLLASKNESQD